MVQFYETLGREKTWHLNLNITRYREGIHEGEIVKWFVKAGDTIEEDDVLAEVQNDKSVVEIPSPVSGTVEEVMVEEGTVAVVGDVIVKIDAPDV